jgi:hypothetical protein
MIDSFIKWARRNEDRAKALDDFIHDGLIAAAKRCESCLKDDLGLTFVEGEEPSEIIEGQVPSGYEVGSTLDIPSDDAFDMTPEDLSPASSEVTIETESDSFGIDIVGRLDDQEMDDLSIDGPPREFSSDFELVEPTDLVVDSPSTSEEEPPAAEPEITETPSEGEDTKPSFTWADYEQAVAPTKEDPELVEEESVELPPPAEIETTEEFSDKPSIPEPPEPPSDDFESSPEEEEESATPITEPPPPPPPPESDEDEDERRRRARRLFFGD